MEFFSFSDSPCGHKPLFYDFSFPFFSFSSSTTDFVADSAFSSGKMVFHVLSTYKMLERSRWKLISGMKWASLEVFADASDNSDLKTVKSFSIIYLKWIWKLNISVEWVVNVNLEFCQCQNDFLNLLIDKKFVNQCKMEIVLTYRISIHKSILLF